jgi:APA family basic amino acid/polyamine antiporter
MTTREIPPNNHPRDQLSRSLSLGGATLLVVSSVIGSGIFFTPGPIAELLPAPGLIFLAWIVGGFLSLAGALANAELGAMFPRAGGDYVYLREAFHPLAGFAVGWLTFFVIYIGTIATLALAFSSGLSAFFDYGVTGTVTVAVTVVLLVSALNYIGLRWGALANNITACFKIIALLALGLAALIFTPGEISRFTPLLPAAGHISLWTFGAALSPVLFSYLGWNASIYVASEIHDPARNVPRSLFMGLAICVFIYMIINAVYIYALPMNELRGVQNAGVAAAQALFGSLGGKLVAVFVLGSILGTLNAMTLIGPRVAYAMALDRLFFTGVDKAHKRYHTPHVAITVQAVGVVLLLLVMTRFPDSLFLSALSYTTFAIILATMADVCALYALRKKQPERIRPYRTWGYPWLPALYVAANGAIALSLLIKRPEECGIGLMVAAVCLPFYLFFMRKSSQHSDQSTEG